MYRYRPIGLLILALLAACGAPITPVPTATPAPTATPIPTPTPFPSPTPIPSPTPPPLGNTIRAALQRTASAATYRLDLALNGSGTLGGVNLGSSETTVIGLVGDFAEDEYQFTLNGFLALFLGADPARGLQVIRADGDSYVRGPLTFLGAPEDGWYELGPEQASLAAPPITAQSSLGLIANADADFSGFQPNGNELIGNQRCERFQGGAEATEALLDSLAQTGLPIDQGGEVQQAETQIVICPDGYLYDLELVLNGTQAADDGGAAYSYVLSVEIRDFNTAITIDPPANARPLPTGPISPAPSP